MALIKEVTSVTAKLKFVFTPGPPVNIRLKLSVKAAGTVISGGWTNGRLVPRIQTPGSNMKIFDFDATPPSGIVPQVVTPITAREWVGNFTAGLKKVVVYSDNNKIMVDITGPLANAVQIAMAEQERAAKAAKAPGKKKPAKKPASKAAKPAPKKKPASKKAKNK